MPTARCSVGLLPAGPRYATVGGTSDAEPSMDGVTDGTGRVGSDGAGVSLVRVSSAHAARSRRATAASYSEAGQVVRTEPDRKATPSMTTDPSPRGNWLQQLFARITGRGSPEPPAAPSRFTKVAEKTEAERQTARREAQADMQAFREEHVRKQGTGDGTYHPDR